jgi:hypothetical protein
LKSTTKSLTPHFDTASLGTRIHNLHKAVRVPAEDGSAEYRLGRKMIMNARALYADIGGQIAETESVIPRDADPLLRGIHD